MLAVMSSVWLCVETEASADMNAIMMTSTTIAKNIKACLFISSPCGGIGLIFRAANCGDILSSMITIYVLLSRCITIASFVPQVLRGMHDCS